jgi:hypothetical protein
MSRVKNYRHTHDDHSSSDEDITSKDMEKIQTLWQDVRQVTFQNLNFMYQNKRDLNSIHTSKPSHQYSSDYKAPAHEAQAFKERLKVTEQQLNEARDNIIILTKKLRDSEEEIEV